MCCGRPVSRESSPIVRKALAALSGPPGMLVSARADDAIAHHLARAEGQHAPRCDRHLDARFRIAADAFALVAEHERAEPRNLDVLALRERVAHMVEHLL